MSEWQLIKTAPKDGTSILLCSPAYDEQICIGRYDEDSESWWLGEYGEADEYDAPTHWMPLPEPPK